MILQIKLATWTTVGVVLKMVQFEHLASLATGP